jgi:hypothetical protein
MLCIGFAWHEFECIAGIVTIVLLSFVIAPVRAPHFEPPGLYRQVAAVKAVNDTFVYRAG